MARKPRFSLVGVSQHVIQRGNNREPCFHGTGDCQRYLGDLREAATRNHCRVHAYVLMTNHVHLLVTPMQEHGVSHLMQDIGRKYVRYVNRTYQRTGTLWEGRYKASLVDSDAYLLTCMRYIELNPVRARMVNHPGEYRWSSYAANAQGEANPLLTPHPVYTQLGTDSGTRQHAYRELFRHHMDNDLLHAIRTALNQELVLGREDFKDRIEQMTARRTRPGQNGRPRTAGAEEGVGDYYVF
jgi:putative transposase